MFFTICMIALFVWLFWKASLLVLKLTWGFTKVLFGGILLLCVPGLAVGVFCAAGFLLLVPVLAVAAIFCILKLAL